MSIPRRTLDRHGYMDRQAQRDKATGILQGHF